MYYYILNEKKEKVLEEKDEKKALLEFTTCLYNKYIVKSLSMKRVLYKYNYDEKQKITFSYSNRFKIVFEDVPTTLAHFNICKLKF